MKEALKSKDQLRLSVLRMAKAAVQNYVISKRTSGQSQPADDLNDDGVITVLSSMIKQRQESVDIYRTHGDEKKASQEEAEVAILREYMPSQLGDDELKKLVEEAIAEANASSPKEMGLVMKALMPKVKGKADGKRVSEAVKKYLVQR